MIARMFKFVLKVILTLIVVGAVVGFAVAKWIGSASAPAPVAPTPIPWGILITMGNPVVPAVPSPTIPPAPLPPPPVVTPTPTLGQQVLLTGLWDYCCGETTQRWPIVLQIEPGGMLYAWEYRNGYSYREFVAGPGVTGIINAVSGWEPQNGGSWTPYFMVTYQDQNGVVTTGLINTRSMFGR